MKLTKDLKMNELIREYRLVRKLSQSDLGKELGVSHAAVSDLERGRTLKMSPKLFHLLLNFIITSGFIETLPEKITNIRGGYPLREEVGFKWEKYIHG